MKKFLPTPKACTERSRSGFTLVELLVVIAIIAVLSAVGLVMYGTAQKSGRVSRRIQDLKAMQTALELYYNANKTYPLTDGTATTPPTWRVISTSDTFLAPQLVPTYMPAIPVDPSNGKYEYASNGTDYKLRAKDATEMTPSDYATQPNLIDPANDGGTYCFKVDGGETAIMVWAIYSSNTGDNDTVTNPNPACW